MSLRFIYGRAGTGKTYFCLNEIKSKLASGVTHPLVLLVPEQFTFQAERDLVNVLKTGGILKSEVLSFRRLAYRVFNEAGGITYPHMHSAGKCMIIFRILEKLKDDLKVFAKSVGREGFVNTLANLITEFKRYNITPEVLDAACRRLDAENPLKDKLLELYSVYAAFEKNLVERYRDTDDDLTLASEKLAGICLYNDAEIWIDGFAGFTPQEYKVIQQLVQKAQRVNITLCTDCLDEKSAADGTDIFSVIKKAYGKFTQIAGELKIKIEPPVMLDGECPHRFRDSHELCHLEQNLYAYPYKTCKEKTKDITIMSSVNIFEEIEAAAEDIVRLCRDEGMRYRDIAVVAGNLAAYEKLIEVIFKEYEIPFFIDRKVDIANHPLVRLILAMLDIFRENWSYESVFRYLKTGLTGIDRSSIDRLENYVLACGIRGSRWTAGEDWNMSPALIPSEIDTEKYDEALREMNRIRYKVLGPLLEFRRKIKVRKTASEVCTALYDFLCNIGAPERIESIIADFKKRGQLVEAKEYSQVWNIVMEVFDQTVEVMGDETFGIERISDILEIGFREYKIGLIPASLDQVLIGSVEHSRSHEIKALYILGANDGVFPSPSAEEGILSDQDRLTLNGAGIELASDTRTKAFDEQYLVYRAFTTAGEKLRISWPIADHEGRTMRPSIMISRLRKLFPAITEISNILQNDYDIDETELPAGRMPAFKRMVSALRQKADGKDISPVWREVYRWFAVQEDWRRKCCSVQEAFRYRNVAEPVSSEKIASLYGEPLYSSVSRLEKYTACPFAYYVQFGLGAKERKVYRLSPPDVGTFMHAVIERFSRMAAEGPLSWREFDREWCSARISEIIDEMLEKMKGSGIAASKRYTALVLRLKRVVTRAVWTIAEHIRRSSFNPAGYELDFGDGGKFPAIVIELASGEKVCLSGRIDRIDALETEEGTYLRIIDYKSGNKDFKLSDVFYGLQVQLITYLDAVCQGDGSCGTFFEYHKNRPLDTPGEPSPCFPGGMLYFKIDDPIIRQHGTSTEEEIEQTIMKQLKMKGLLLADVKLIKDMDNTIEGSSMIIPATLNKGDILGKNTSAASAGQFTMLRKYVRKLLKGLCEEIMKGNVSIKPYKMKGATSCKYCSFMPVCQFDTAMKENSYRPLYEKEDKEVWEHISVDSGQLTADS